jgi:Fe2+ or Zn2+ uptake regulation protein
MDRAEPDKEKRGCAAEAAHFFMCNRCGQYVDRRRAEEVRHHQRLSHKPLAFG